MAPPVINECSEKTYPYYRDQLSSNVSIPLDDCSSGIDNDCDATEYPADAYAEASTDGLNPHLLASAQMAAAPFKFIFRFFGAACAPEPYEYNSTPPAPFVCPDNDGDGHQSDICGGAETYGYDDCNDNDASVHPGVEEIVGNGKDDNCNGRIDEVKKPFVDSDGDGVENENDRCPSTEGPSSNRGCPEPDEDGDGVPDSRDHCDHDPGPENCDNLSCDNDGCAPGCPKPCSSDLDGDGHNGFPSGGDDCYDQDSRRHPGAHEITCEGAAWVDQACNGPNDEDADCDGYTIDEGDCNDRNANSGPWNNCGGGGCDCNHN